ncbi:response regulator [Halobaculum magnesiiphilum]|uniref:Response regulator n=1 Tax=Halobaculum magnesiiphilum TaxID=1017351 RepID=A0A8T8WAX7_9EURY|nr:response regulator [Halobaculum magnesiiphilum]QZP36913.1 response regulator [Halobaculum magnesiiphilum]
MSDDASATVLLVDDEAALVSLYEAYLGDRYEVETATDGEEALSVADDSVDVALLDRRMPGMNGEEVLRELRAAEIDCRVAMLTAVEPTVDIVDMPFDDYRVKPVDESELIGLVDVLIERASYDERSQEFFALASKKAALEIAGETSTDAYATLCDDIEAVRSELDDHLDAVGAEAAFSDVA